MFPSEINIEENNKFFKLQTIEKQKFHVNYEISKGRSNCLKTKGKAY